MFREEKNLKDSEEKTVSSHGSNSLNMSLISYAKVDKLITALYMVTDIIDKDEPLRNKLRTLGTGIISDMHLTRQNNTGSTLSFMSNKIAEIMSFLDIASSVNIISEMNCNILKKEFSKLDKSILDSTSKAETINRRIALSEFFTEVSADEEAVEENFLTKNFIVHDSKRHSISKMGNSIGLQKGSTLLKALSGVKIMSNIKNGQTSAVFDDLKKQRRESIVNIIKNITVGATLKDIKDRAQTGGEKFNVLINCSEKTLQRELMSMVKDNVLDKTGEKRWSKYFLK